eukprot:GHVU01027174.1.p2 GENE.GHVU01027174.1~~GHVU01027174.1.p2  ORF type:complete len:143 (-),score=21.82 GHVU01027174.1:539-967(-)
MILSMLVSKYYYEDEHQFMVLALHGLLQTNRAICEKLLELSNAMAPAGRGTGESRMTPSAAARMAQQGVPVPKVQGGAEGEAAEAPVDFQTFFESLSNDQKVKLQHMLGSGTQQKKEDKWGFNWTQLLLVAGAIYFFSGSGK